MPRPFFVANKAKMYHNGGKDVMRHECEKDILPCVSNGIRLWRTVFAMAQGRVRQRCGQLSKST